MPKTRNIDFETLSLSDALDFAVLVEEEARDRYEELADQLEVHHTPEAAAFFRFMAKNEEKRRSRLVARRAEAFGDEPAAISSNMIFDIEAPEYDGARAFMTVRQALETALRSERKAYDFFVSVLPAIKDPAVRALIEELRDEVVKHQVFVKSQLSKEPLGHDGDPYDYDDGPTSQ